MHLPRLEVRRRWREFWMAPCALPLVQSLALLGLGGLPLVLLARILPVGAGVALLTLLMSAMVASLVLMLVTLMAKPGGRALQLLAWPALLLVPAAMASTHELPVVLGGIVSLVALLSYAIVAAVLGSTLLVRLLRLPIWLFDWWRSCRDEPSLDHTVTSWLRRQTPTVRATAVVGGLALIWRATSWMFTIGGPADNAPMRYVGAALESILPFLDRMAESVLGAALLTVAVVLMQASSTAAPEHDAMPARPKGDVR